MGGHEGHAQKKRPCLGWNGISKELIQKKWEKITVEVAMKHLQRNDKNVHKWIYLVICEASNTASLFDVSDGGNDWKVLHIQVIIYLIWTFNITTSLFFEFNTYKSGIKHWQARVKLTHVFHSWLARSKFSLSSLHSILGPIHAWAKG